MMMAKKDEEILESRRVLFLSGAVNNESAKETIEKLLSYQYASPTEEITMIIDSWGGKISSMFAIIDTIDIIRCDVRTICIGAAMSAAACILACGTKGKRFITKNSRYMIHQIHHHAEGNTKDIIVDAEEIKKMQERMGDIFSERTKITKEQYDSLIERDKYLSPEEVIELGICDGILESL